MRKKKSKKEKGMPPFDTAAEALDYIEKLKAQKRVGYLTSTLIEAVYDRYGRIEEGLYEWGVREK